MSLSQNDNVHNWKVLLQGAQERLTHAMLDGDGVKGKNWSLAAGICQDHLHKLEGRPSSIVLNLHAHRFELPHLLKTVSQVAERIRLGDQLRAETTRLDRLSCQPGEQAQVKGRALVAGTGSHVSEATSQVLDSIIESH